MNELIHDIEESLRQEKIQAMWREYGPYIIGGALLAILFTALSATWQSHTTRVNSAQTATMIEALNSPDPAAGLEKITTTLRPGERSLAFLTEAGNLLQKDKKAEALVVYDKAVADKSLPEPFHSLAVLLDVRLAWTVKGDKADAKALIAQLQPVIGDEKSPWHYHARLQAALIAAHGLNDYDQARSLLAPIMTGGDDIAPTLKERANALDIVYAAQGGKEPK